MRGFNSETITEAQAMLPIREDIPLGTEMEIMLPRGRCLLFKYVPYVPVRGDKRKKTLPPFTWKYISGETLKYDDDKPLVRAKKKVNAPQDNINDNFVIKGKLTIDVDDPKILMKGVEAFSYDIPIYGLSK